MGCRLNFSDGCSERIQAPRKIKDIKKAEKYINPHGTQFSTFFPTFAVCVEKIRGKQLNIK